MLRTSSNLVNSYIRRNFRIYSKLKHVDEIKIREKPQVPLVCCGSGCQNCVWLQYADDLIKFYADNFGKSEEGIKEAIKEIEKLEDINLRSYLIIELTMKLRK